MKKLFLISLLIGNVSFAKVGSLVTGTLVGGAVGYVAGKSGNGETKVIDNTDGHIFKCNCKMVCNVVSTFHEERKQVKVGQQTLLEYRKKDVVMLTADRTKEDGCELIK